MYVMMLICVCVYTNLIYMYIPTIHRYIHIQLNSPLRPFWWPVLLASVIHTHIQMYIYIYKYTNKFTSKAFLITSRPIEWPMKDDHPSPSTHTYMHSLFIKTYIHTQMNSPLRPFWWPVLLASGLWKTPYPEKNSER
jgi:hypothetical protein